MKSRRCQYAAQRHTLLQKRFYNVLVKRVSTGMINPLLQQVNSIIQHGQQSRCSG